LIDPFDARLRGLAFGNMPAAAMSHLAVSSPASGRGFS
jgi:hypothetical protein